MARPEGEPARPSAAAAWAAADDGALRQAWQRFITCPDCGLMCIGTAAHGRSWVYRYYRCFSRLLWQAWVWLPARTC